MSVSTNRQTVLRRVGVLGGGQLGRMMANAAHCIGCKIIVLDPTPNSPAGQAADEQIVGDFRDAGKIEQLAQRVDVITMEIEHVNVDALYQVKAKYPNVDIQPYPSTIRVIQDKYLQKCHFQKHCKLAVLGEFESVSDDSVKQDIERIATKFGYPLMLKSRCLAYDGRGNAVVKTQIDIEPAIKSLVSPTGLYVEKWVHFERELAVMVAKARDGSVVSYPVVDTFQRDNICHTVVAPAQVSSKTMARAKEMAESAISTLEGAGVFGVELFLLKDGTISLNEVAPRPHNSGHYTIEACNTSQFEQHLRAVLGLPLGLPTMRVGASIMINILGTGSSEKDFDATWALSSTALSGDTRSSLHWYGKEGVRAGRKVGHVTFTGDFMPDLLFTLASLGSDFADNPVLSESYKLEPIVGIIMGSDSDLPTMEAAANILKEFGVPFELTIVSAHRTPSRMFDYASSAHSRGLKVIIAGAGGAAHLPGMVAAITPLPVIGVPVPLKYLDGQDSLMSIVQMPRGVPVATVAIGNATNAGILAVRILSIQAPSLLEKMMKYQKQMELDVMEKVERLKTL